VGIVVVWAQLEWRRHWRSLTVLALLIALATATVLTAWAGARRGQTSIDRLLAPTRPATVMVLPNQPGFDWSKIAALPEVRALATFAVAGVWVAGGPPVAEQTNSFPFTNTQIMNTIERPVVLAGRRLNPARAGEVVVTPAFVAHYGRGVGDTLTLELASPGQAAQGYDGSSGGQPAGPRVRVRIVGVVRSAWFSDDPSAPGQVIPSPALFARYRPDFMGPHDNTFINALVRLRGGAAAIPAFRAGLARVTGRTDIDVLDINDSQIRPIRHLISYEAACLAAFGLAALVAALFLVGQSIARYVTSTMSELRVLQATGMTPWQAVAAASAAPFAAAVAGASAGVGGAVLASRWMPIGAASLAEPHPGIQADWLVLGPGWAIAPLLVLAGAAAVAGAALAASRAQSLPHRSAVAAALARAGLGVPAVIGTRFALEPGRGQAAVPVRPALAGTVAGVLGVLATFTFAAGVSDAAANPARFGQTAQLESFLGFNGQDFGPSGRVLPAVAADRDVAGLDDARQAVAQSGAVSMSTFSYAPVDGKRLPVVLTSGRMPAGPGQIALAPTTARELHARVGSVLPVTGTSGTRPTRVTGIAFVPEGPHNSYDEGAWVTPAGYTRLFRGAHYAFKFDFALLFVRPGANVAAVAHRVNAIARRIPGGAALSFSPLGPPQETQALNDISALPFALGAFLALLAAGAVGNALIAAVRRRGHELAVLRAMGLTRRQARLILVSQATVLAVTGLAFGIPLGLAAGSAVWRVVAYDAPLAYHAPQALWALVLIAPLTLLAANLLAAWPGQRAARLRSAQILRTE
jgi:FtsX-like permease family